VRVSEGVYGADQGEKLELVILLIYSQWWAFLIETLTVPVPVLRIRDPLLFTSRIRDAFKN
jgi:hypothetical protein